MLCALASANQMVHFTALVAGGFAVAAHGAFTTSCKDYVSTYACKPESITDEWYKPLAEDAPAAQYAWSFLLTDQNFLDESSASGGEGSGWHCFAGMLGNNDCNGACATAVETKTGFDNLAECLAYAKLPWQSVGSANWDPREGGTCTLFSDNAIYHNTLENPRLQNAAESTPWRGYCAGHFNNGNSCARRGNTCAPAGCATEEARMKQGYFCVAPAPAASTTAAPTTAAPAATTQDDGVVEQLQADVATLKDAVAKLIADNAKLSAQLAVVNVLNINRDDETGICSVGCDNGKDGGVLQLK